MKRRSFFKAIVAIAVTPKILEQLPIAFKKEYFMGGLVEYFPEPTGKVVIIGTPIHENRLLKYIPKNEWNYTGNFTEEEFKKMLKDTFHTNRNSLPETIMLTNINYSKNQITVLRNM